MVCGETFDSTDELSDHVSQIHSLPEYSCKLCGKQCKDDKALQKHLMVHDTSDNKCIICSKRFHSRARLKRYNYLKPYQYVVVYNTNCNMPKIYKIMQLCL